MRKYARMWDDPDGDHLARLPKDRRNGLMKHSNALVILAAFVVGQLVQLLAHALTIDLWASRQIPVCAAAGFLVAVAVLAGMYIMMREQGANK